MFVVSYWMFMLGFRNLGVFNIYWNLNWFRDCSYLIKYIVLIHLIFQPFIFIFDSQIKFLSATFESTERKYDFANWVMIFHIAKPDNPVTLLGQIMGGSGVAFGHHSVCQIIVFFVLTLFVVDNKMAGNTVCWFKIFKGNITWDLQKQH